MAGHFSHRQLTQHAWHLVSGSKRPVFWVLFVMLLVFCLANFLIIFIQQTTGLDANTTSWGSNTITFALFLMVQFIMAPLVAGCLMFGITKIRGTALQPFFSYFRKWLPLGITALIVLLLELALTFLLYLPVLTAIPKTPHALLSSSLWVNLLVMFLLGNPVLMFALSFVADKNLNPLYATWHAIKITFRRYFSILLFLLILLLIQLVVIAVCVILYVAFVWLGATLGIPQDTLQPILVLSLLGLWTITLLWTLPWAILMWGGLYHALVDHPA